MTLAGLYLHIPFCRRICPYCDFAVRTGDGARRRRFAESLCGEIRLHAGEPLAFDTIYFGGGTPSGLDLDTLGRILEAVRAELVIEAGAGVFLEANPEDVTRESVAGFRALGVETLSLGVQSFDAAALSFLGRAHDPSRGRRAVETALAAGFRTVSLDLIYGWPGQDAASWRNDLEAAAASGVQHLSCYQLTIHERTRFGLLARRGALVQLDADSQGDLFRVTHRRLAELGFAGYEVSNFAAGPEHRSRHNRKYWSHAPYLGLGPSAHSFVGRRRSWNLRRTEPWEARIAAGEPPVEASEKLDGKTLALEALMLGLRTADGVDLGEVRRRFGVDLARANEALVDRLASEGLLAIAGPRLQPTLEGLAVADALAGQFEV